MSARLPASATVGASVERIRRTAGLTQGDVAKRVHMSAATISRIENGETGTSLADIDAILRGINTEAAQGIPDVSHRSVRHLKRPSFHHPDRAHLWRADQLLKDTHQLKIGALAAFEKQVVVYETEIESAARFPHGPISRYCLCRQDRRRQDPPPSVHWPTCACVTKRCFCNRWYSKPEAAERRSAKCKSSRALSTAC